MLRKLIAGNWKMHGGAKALDALQDILGGVPSPGPDVLICPPSTLIQSFAAHASGSRVAIGGQDCHPEASGAHTGDIAAEMLAAAGATYVIAGHSERRTDHAEADALVAAKVRAAWRAGLVAIICVGENEDVRDHGEAAAVVAGQCRMSIPDGATGANTAIAYEPVWAIGTGRTPSPAEIHEIHTSIRSQLGERFGHEGGSIRLLYGGSVKPTNAADIFAVPDVDGALVGGASLRAAGFLPIVRAAA